MDIFIWTLLAGMATAFTTELINGLFYPIWWFPQPRTIRLALTLPLCFGASWLLGVTWPEIVVTTLAAAFFCNAILLLVDRASIVVTPRR